MSAPELKTLQATYAGLWQRMTPKEGKQAAIVSAAHRCLAGKDRYKTVADKLGLPTATGWAFIACLHYREANLNFHCHLHNGDSLTARTVHVPAGRPLAPANPPFTWEESAEDALKMRGVHALVTELTSVEGFAYASEGYNGWGYFWHDVTSPYLWGGTSDQQPGKYVRDGVWDASFEDPQLGVMPLLQAIQALDPTVVFGGAASVAPPRPPATHVAPVPAPTSESPKGSWVHTLAVVLSTVLGAFSSVAQAIDAIRPYLQDPVVVGALLAALAALGIVIYWEHHRAHPAA